MKSGALRFSPLKVAAALCLLLAGVVHAQAVPDLKLDPFARDHIVFDSGAARGLDAAKVPLSGNAPAGSLIEGRFVTDAGVVTTWTTVGEADAGGVWRGSLGPLPRGAGWVRPQVRLQESDSIVTAGQHVSAGHVVAIWGQSELHRAVLPAHAALHLAATIQDPDALQVTCSTSAQDDYGTTENLTHVRVSDGAPLSAHIVSLSNMFARAAPGERFHLIFHTRAGTGFQQLLSDQDRGRTWSDDVAMQRFALPRGARPGLAWISWYNSDSSLGPFYGPVLRTALTGRTAEGTPFPRGTAPPGSRVPFDHLFPDLYGPNMIWAVAGPHRFEMDQFDARIAANRASVDETFTGQTNSLRRALEPLTYLNGNPRWNGDYSHPDTVDDPANGMTRLMLLMGNSVLRQLGLVQWPLPAFDRSRLSSDGRVVEVWSSAGPVNTTRAAGSDGSGLPVAGFAINGETAENARLQNGRVVIRPNDGDAPFGPGTRLTFGAGGIGSDDLERDTRVRQIWKDYPIVDVGQTGLEGIPVKAQTPQSVLNLFDPIDTLQSALPPGNLLGSQIANFVPADGAPGWTANGTGWTFDPATATAAATLTSTGGVRAALDRNAMVPHHGQRLLFTFVPETTGSDDEVLRVVISATGGGATELFSEDVLVTPGRRMILELAPFPTNRSSISIVFRRRGAPTGDLSLGSLGLFRAR